MQTIPMGKGYVSWDGNAYARGAQAVLFRKVDEGLQAEFPITADPLTDRLGETLPVLAFLWTKWTKCGYFEPLGPEGTTVRPTVQKRRERLVKAGDSSGKRCVLPLLLFRYVLVSPIFGSRVVTYIITTIL